MIEKLKYLFAGVLAVSLCGVFVACDNEDDTVTDEWTSNYVYMERLSLGVNTMKCNWVHTISVGVLGDVQIKLPVAVRLHHPFASDVTVKLAYEVQGEELLKNAFSFVEGGTLVIPAGELLVRDTLMFDTNTDLSPLAAPAADYTVKTWIEAVEPVSGDLRISSKQRELQIAINKSEKADIVPNMQPEGARITNKTGWGCALTADAGGPEVEWEWGYSKVVDGDLGNYVFFGTTHLGIKIDMGSVRTLSGVESYCSYGTSYCMTSGTLYASEDGEKWTLLSPDDGFEMDQGSRQFVKFIVPVQARYIIWHQDGGNSKQVLISEFFAWAK